MFGVCQGSVIFLAYQRSKEQIIWVENGYFPALHWWLWSQVTVVVCHQVTLCVTQQLFCLAQGSSPDIGPEEECLQIRILRFISTHEHQSIYLRTSHPVTENCLWQNKRVRMDLQISTWLTSVSGNTAHECFHRLWSTGGS